MNAIVRVSSFVDNLKLAAAALNGNLLPAEVRTLVAAQSLQSAGITVTADTIFAISSANRAIQLIATTLATAPMVVRRVKFERREGVLYRWAEEAPDHPLYRTLRYEPNRDMDAVQFWELAIAQLIVFGDHYSFRGRRSRRGTVGLELIPLSTPEMISRRREPSRPLSRLGLTNTGVFAQGLGRSLNPDDWFGMHWLSLDGEQTGGLLRHAQTTLSVAAAAQGTFASFLAGGMMAGGIASPEAPINAKQWEQLKRVLNDPDEPDSPSGWRNSGRLFVPPFPMKVLSNFITAKDSQLLEARQHQDIAVGRYLGIPAFMFSADQGARAQATVGDNQFTRLALKPWAARVAAAVNRQLIADPEFEAEFDLFSIMAGDRINELEGDQIELETGQASPNELRARHGKPPVKGGDQVFIAGNNLVPIDGPFPQQVKMEQTTNSGGRRERRRERRSNDDDE